MPKGVVSPSESYLENQQTAVEVCSSFIAEPMNNSVDNALVQHHQYALPQIMDSK